MSYLEEIEIASRAAHLLGWRQVVRSMSNTIQDFNPDGTHEEHWWINEKGEFMCDEWVLRRNPKLCQSIIDKLGSTVAMQWPFEVTTETSP